MIRIFVFHCWMQICIHLVVVPRCCSRSLYPCSTATFLSFYNEFIAVVLPVFHLPFLFIIDCNAFEWTQLKCLRSSWCHEVFVEVLRFFGVVSNFFQEISLLFLYVITNNPLWFSRIVCIRLAYINFFWVPISVSWVFHSIAHQANIGSRKHLCTAPLLCNIFYLILGLFSDSLVFYS